MECIYGNKVIFEISDYCHISSSGSVNNNSNDTGADAKFMKTKLNLIDIKIKIMGKYNIYI